jgi:hypothetical protein
VTNLMHAVVPVANKSNLTAIYAGKADSYAELAPDVVAADLAALAKLPVGFTPVTTKLPSHDRPVLAIRRAAYTGCDLEIITARFMLDYRPNSPWRDISGDAVSDSGCEILGWHEASELLNFR